MVQQYRKIVQRIKTESPNTHIYLQSILPRAAFFQDLVEDYNAEIKKIASDLSVTYIDLYPYSLAEDGSIIDAYSNDELHLLGVGYQLWQSQIKTYVEGYR
jgi:lysophospholipase L1-like esterase